VALRSMIHNPHIEHKITKNFVGPFDYLSLFHQKESNDQRQISDCSFQTLKLYIFLCVVFITYLMFRFALFCHYYR